MSESGEPGEQVREERGRGDEAGSPAERAEGKPEGRGKPEGQGQPDGGEKADSQGEPGGRGHSGGQAGPQVGGHRLPDPWGELMHLADQVAVGRALSAVGAVVPAWRRRTRGEHRWPVSASVITAIVLQVLLPNSLIQPVPHALLPILEGALLVGLSIANPVRIERRGPVIRAASIGLIMLITAANAVSAVLLIRAIVTALPTAGSAAPLLTSGASVWATNVIAFGLWYWEFDRGGPLHRAQGTRHHPDLMFPQMASPPLAAPGLGPYFVDYLYLSFTNATPFRPPHLIPLPPCAHPTTSLTSPVPL